VPNFTKRIFKQRSDFEMKKILMLLAVLLLSACGTVATPVWEQAVVDDHGMGAEHSEGESHSEATAEAHSEAAVVAVEPTVAATEAPTATPLAATATPMPTEVPTMAAVPTEVPTMAAAEPVAAVDAASAGDVAAPALANEPDPLPDAALQEEYAVLALVADPENGAAIFNRVYPETGFACATCHSIQPGVRLIGPTVWGIRDHGLSRVEGMNIETYIHNSILHPLAYIAPGWTVEQAIMPRNYADVLSEDEISDLTAYLLSLG
jgi:hypothetical protein